MDSPDWLDRAQPVETPVLDVGFVVWEDFYHGPEDDFTDEQWQTLREPLYQPVMNLHDLHVNYVFTPALESSASELARHYADVVRVAQKHGRQVPASHFWLTPFIFLPGNIFIQFAFHDTRDDAERLLDALESPVDGEIYDDVDQGWELSIWARGDRMFIRNADFDTQEEHAVISCEREALVGQVAPLRARLNRILAELRATLGHDYWSRGGGPHPLA